MDAASQDQTLRQIDLRALPLGKPIPATIYDNSGRVLAAAGTTLSEQQIDALMSSADETFVGPDWPGATDEIATPSKGQPSAVDDLADDVDKLIKELRGSKRHSYSAKLTVEIDERGDRSGAKRRVVVTTRDISSGGFALECDGFVHEGAEVIACFDHLPGRPHIVGVVRSCFHIEGRRHRVGVEFVRVLKRSSSGA